MTSVAVAGATSRADREPSGTDPVARMIAALPEALLCSDPGAEIFPVGGLGSAETDIAHPHPVPSDTA